MDQPVGDHKAFLEITLADYGRTVIYNDTHNNSLRDKYHFPAYMVAAHSNYATLAHSIKNKGISTAAFDSLDQSQFLPSNA